MEVKELVRVFVKGGIISPGDFLKILLVAEKLGAQHVHLGSRQDILFPAVEKSKTILDRTFTRIDTEYEVNTFEYQNISSSYVAQDILPGKKWLASHIYHYILNSFDYRPKLRINLVDPSQSLVPLFTGQINFIASNQENYWYVYLRFQEIQEAPWQLPVLIFTENLHQVARTIEQENLIDECHTYQDIYDHLIHHLTVNTQPVTEDLTLPETHFPYYEGINRLSEGKYWIGLYWRTNEYRISILKAMMSRCIDTEVGKVSLTPWKSFLIKGVFEKDLVGWEKLLGKFGMNMRHSALELNWHLPALDEEALDLKLFLVRELDRHDISTYGLTFTIKTSEDITLFTSIVIEKNLKNLEDETYNILFSKEFNPNLGHYQIYASDVPKTILTSLIVELSLLYFENLKDEPLTSPRIQSITDRVQRELYQCNQCLTIYDTNLGDKFGKIEPGTPFEQLPNDYACPTCGSGKKEFQLMN